MKNLFLLLLSLMLVLALAACNDSADTPENTDSPGTSDNSGDNKDTSGSGGSESSTPSESKPTEECVLCYDIEGLVDRKCDKCGGWIHPNGEVWTNEVPENLSITVDDGKFFYAVEKIGEDFYVKMWSGKEEMDNGDIPYEDFVRLNKRYTRFKGNAAQSEWSDDTFQTKYADVYELFAVLALQSLNGSTISSMIEDCEEVTSSGTEMVAGKNCVIKEYDGLFGNKYKVWLWNNMPLKRMYKNQNMDNFEIMYEIHEWNDTLAGFSTDIPD